MNNTYVSLGEEKGVPYGYVFNAPDGATKLRFSIPGWGERGDGHYDHSNKTGELTRVENVSLAHWIKSNAYPYTDAITITNQYPVSADLCYHKTFYTFVQKMIAKFKASPVIELFGLSGGGNSAANFVDQLKANNALNPTLPQIQVSAVILISCQPNPAKAAEYLNTKTWVIIGDQDTTNDGKFLSQSKLFVEKLNALKPATPAILTLVPFQGHEASVWNNATKYRTVFDWMLKSN